MPALIEIAFKGNRKEFFFWDGESPPPVRAAVIVDADRGEDLGHVHATGELAEKRNAGAAHGLGGAEPSKRARRLATSADVQRLDDVRAQDDDARQRGMERVRANHLAMKLSDAEWQWDRKKLTFYFTAEKRVDFRNLVRELAAMFRTRIELKQIGVRDEAKRLDGIGRCGRPYCSSSWLPELRPVNLGVAKDQRLSLNPSQISGACGRLMCCLRYEHEFYVQQRRRFPKEGRIIRTALGEEKVVANDIFRERVTLRSAEGEMRIVSLVDLNNGGESASASSAVDATGVDDADIAHASVAPDHDIDATELERSGAEASRAARGGPERSSRGRPRDGGRERGASADAKPRTTTGPAPAPEAGRPSSRDRRPRSTSDRPAPSDAPPRSEAAPRPERQRPKGPASTTPRERAPTRGQPSADPEPSPAVPAAAPGEESERDAAERKSPRRRGRRGGRRNRARERGDGEGGSPAPDTPPGSPAPDTPPGS